MTIDVRADAFLRRMVRRIVAALLRSASARWMTDAVRSALAGPGPAFAGAVAPAQGLCLRRVVLGRTVGATTNGEHEER